MNKLNIQTNKRIVYGEGPEDAKIAFVGEAPGRNEAQKGRPFVGRAGQLLDECMRKAGILRRSCYITNVVKEKPHKNNIKNFINIKKSSVDTTKKYDQYFSYLLDELREVDPNVIITVGGTATYALTGKRGITKWRGSILESNQIPGQKVIPTIHTSAALKKYVWRYYIIHDLKRAKKERNTSALPQLNHRYYIDPTLTQVREYLEGCKESDLVAFDIEVSGVEMSCISLSYEPNSAISIPFSRGYRMAWTPPEEVEIMETIGEILEDPDTKVVAHNAMFDTTFLYRKYGIKVQNIEDTMVAQALSYPDFDKDLGFITSIYTKIPYYKDAGKFRHGQSDDDFWLYNAKDSIVLTTAYPKLMDELDEVDNEHTYKRTTDLIEPLLYMTERGIQMDVEGLERKAEEAKVRLQELEEQLEEVVGHEINPRSHKQLKEYFYEELGLDPYKSRSTGRPTTNEEALKRLSRRGFDAANILLEFRKLSKLHDTYFTVDLHSDGRLRSSLNPVGTRYGRLSSSKDIFGKGMNMQNQPYIMRKYMLADEGYCAYEIDLGQAENRVVAYLGPEPNMIEAFEEDRDIHKLTASMIFGKPIEEISAEPGSSDVGNGEHSERHWGKKANHALNYGMGYKKFSYINEIPEKEGKVITEQYHDAYPGVRKFHEQVKEQLRKDRSLTNLYGRRNLFLERWGSQLFNQAYSFIPQSTVADKINRDGILHIYENQDLYSEVELLLQVHDSIIFQIPLDAGWRRHAEIIRGVAASLESPLEYRGREFTIPAEVQMMPVNLRDCNEFLLDEVDEPLHSFMQSEHERLIEEYR